MIKKALTYLTILAISALPMQLISASVETVSMQLSMGQQMQTKSGAECLHEMNSESETVIKKSCCDQQSQKCQNCNNCPQAVSVMLSSTLVVEKSFLVNSPKITISHLVLNGFSQKNLLRPPRNLI